MTPRGYVEGGVLKGEIRQVEGYYSDSVVGLAP